MERGRGRGRGEGEKIFSRDVNARLEDNI